MKRVNMSTNQKSCATIVKTEKDNYEKKLIGVHEVAFMAEHKEDVILECCKCGRDVSELLDGEDISDIDTDNLYCGRDQYCMP